MEEQFGCFLWVYQLWNILKIKGNKEFGFNWLGVQCFFKLFKMYKYIYFLNDGFIPAIQVKNNSKACTADGGRGIRSTGNGEDKWKGAMVALFK